MTNLKAKPESYNVQPFKDYVLKARDIIDFIDSFNGEVNDYGNITVADVKDILGIRSEFIDRLWGYCIHLDLCHNFVDGFVENGEPYFKLKLPDAKKLV